MAERKPVYIRCPSCELNYCLKKDKMCSVCRAEMEGSKDVLVDDLELELCPICKTNYIRPDEIMCTTCLEERKANGDDGANEEEWDAYINRDEDVNDFAGDPDEETGDMASITDFEDDLDLDDDLDFGLDDDLGLDEEFEEKMEEEFEDDFEELDEDDIDDDDFDDDDFDDK